MAVPPALGVRHPKGWPAHPIMGSTWREAEAAQALRLGFVAGGSGRDGLGARAIAAHASSGAAP